MRVLRDQAWRAFEAAPEAPWWSAVRIKAVREQALLPGGRTRLTLFEKVTASGRPHPRLRTEMPPVTDPSPTIPDFQPTCSDAAGFREALAAALAQHRAWRRGDDLDASAAPRGSERYWQNSICAQRTGALLQAARDWLDAAVQQGRFPATEATAARYGLAALGDEAFAGELLFDNADTGTYHSFQHDKPFVHYLEAVLATLPEEASEAFAVLPPEQQESVLRQRAQARNHLDHLMRHKYANDGIVETDIERSLGGLLIDRDSRHIASETWASRDSLVPAYELLRIDPGSDHAHAGAWVYRDDSGGLHLEDGAPVTVPEAALRSQPLPAARLTFQRAPHDPRLRSKMRFDWDGNGYVSHEPVGWVSWAGHCDIKAILEQLGLALLDGPTLSELRSDTGRVEVYSRDLLLEMLASVLELGSSYNRLDGTGRVRRGIQRFGGARNDSLPDRLQFKGLAEGRSFRFPTVGRQESFRVTRIQTDQGDLNLERCFQRSLPDLELLDFADNPRYAGTVEGDYNIIDVSGTLIEAEVMADSFDPVSGYPVRRRETVRLDLRAAAPGALRGRALLGTQIKDASRRELYRYSLDLDANQIVRETLVWTREEGSWVASPGAEAPATLPLLRPLRVTLSRESRQDDPALFQALLSVALRGAQNINADTDARAEVWNGTVTQINTEKLGENASARVERWRLRLRARFGSATLDYLMRRAEDGGPVAFCPLGSESGGAPDFLWQDFPDVGSKGVEGADWIVNEAMQRRGVIAARPAPGLDGDTYIYDDHIKNIYEMIFCALSGHRWTLVHGNKRFGFTDEAAWRQHADQLQALRAALRFEEPAD